MKKVAYLITSLVMSLALLTGCGRSKGSDIVTADTEAPPAAFTEEATQTVVTLTDAPTAEPTEEPTTPPTVALTDGHDYNVLRVFFEKTDENGVTNGAKCFANYDPDMTATWNDDSPECYKHVFWDESGRVTRIDMKFAGEEPVKLAGCLDVSGFEALGFLMLSNASVEELRAERMPMLDIKTSSDIELPYVEGEAYAAGGYIERVYLRSAVHVRCEITGEAESSLAVLPAYTVDVNVEGRGYAGIAAYSDEAYYVVKLTASPEEGARFIGWFDEDGTLVSSDADYEITSAPQYQHDVIGSFAYTARFE